MSKKKEFDTNPNLPESFKRAGNKYIEDLKKGKDTDKTEKKLVEEANKVIEKLNGGQEDLDSVAAKAKEFQKRADAFKKSDQSRKAEKPLVEKMIEAVKDFCSWVGNLCSKLVTKAKNAAKSVYDNHLKPANNKKHEEAVESKPTAPIKASTETKAPKVEKKGLLSKAEKLESSSKSFAENAKRLNEQVQGKGKGRI